MKLSTPAIAYGFGAGGKPVHAKTVISHAQQTDDIF